MRTVAFALLVWTLVFGTACARGGELDVFPQSIEMQFPDGYEVRNDAGKVLKRVAGPTSATIKAKTSRKAFAAGDVYLSDWSYDQLQKGGKPNWIMPKVSGTATTAAQVSASSGASTGLIVYPAIKEMTFPEGYSVFRDNGQLIKTVPGPSSATLMAESGAKSFARGVAYLSDWSYEQLRKGRQPNWIVGCAAERSVASQEAQTAGHASLAVHFPPKVCLQRTTSYFSKGYELLTNDGQLIKTVSGSASAETEGYSEGLPFVRGRAYLAASSIDRMLAGQEPLWIRDRASGTSALVEQRDPAASLEEVVDKMVRLVESQEVVGRTKSSAKTSESDGAPTSRGMNIVSAHRVDAKSPSQLMLYPDPVPVTFPYGYEVYDSGGGLLESVSGPKTQVLRGKVGNACVSNYIRLDEITTLNPESVVSSLGVLPLDCTVAVNNLVGLSTETANGIVAVLNSLQMGSKKDAEALSAQRELQLNGLESLSPTAAAALANFGANSFRLHASLSLKNVKSLDAASVKALLRFSGLLFLNWSDESSSSETSEMRSTASDRILFLSEEGYEALRKGEQARWIGIPKGESLYYPTHADKDEDIWSAVNTSIVDAASDESDPWMQIDEVNGSAIIYDIVTARHPATRKAFAETGAVYQHSGFGDYWQTFQIDGFSHSPELASGNLQYLGPATFDALAMMTRQERDWLNASLPATYQAIADIFRNDFLGSKDAKQATTVADFDLPKNAIFLRFYRSPFVPGKSSGNYLRWGDLDQVDRRNLTSANATKQPSFYGVQIYANGKMAGNYPLFGAVDLEAFAEIMLRNYTKRKAGLSLDSTDEWLQGFFESIYQGVFGRIRRHLVGAGRIYWQAEGYFHLIPLDLIAITCGSSDGIANIPMVEVADAAAIGRASTFSKNIRDLGALLVANPEYNQGGQQNRGDSICDDSTAKLVSRAFSNRSLSFSDLPGADEEVDRLTSKLKAAGIKDVNVLRKEGASEAALLEKLSNSGLAHIATHGFYLDMTLATDERSKQLFNELKNSTNPYFRSGLALTGANATLAEWSQGNVKETATDGVLLASEVKDLDLNNLSLLVLSACSTAEGKPVDGKSVASLREAFLQAGVETLVTTLWDIPDDFAVKLMGDFYHHLLAGDTPSIALWRAKKDNFLQLRKSTGFAESMVKVAPFVAVTQAAKPD
jgi:hypothetical protein